MNNISNIFQQLSKISEILGLETSDLLSKLSRITNHDIEILESIIIQISKLSVIDKSVVNDVVGNLLKINEIDSSVTERVITQLTKMAGHDVQVISDFSNRLYQSIQKKSELSKNIADSISDGQLLSKWWLASEVQKFNLGTIFLCAGWFAVLLTDSKLKFKQCISIDSDSNCEVISKIIHKNLLIDSWKFQSVTEDIHNIDYKEQLFKFKRSNGTVCDVNIVPNTIINTSCEHIDNFSKWYESIPSDKLIILQSNNGFDIDGHINCVKTLEEFKSQTPMKIELYSGEKEMPKFTRFMRIGYR